MTIDDNYRSKNTKWYECRCSKNISIIISLNWYEYVTGEEILQSDQSRIIEEAQFTYPPLGKGFEKQIKAI